MKHLIVVTFRLKAFAKYLNVKKKLSTMWEKVVQSGNFFIILAT